MSEYVGLPDVFATSDASLALIARALPTLDERIVPAYHTLYDVEPYYVALGYPVADTALGIDATTVVEAWPPSAAAAYPALYDAAVTADLAPASRWLPLTGTFDDAQTWVAFAGSERVDLDADGTSPYLDTEFEYLRGRRFMSGSAMRLDDGDYLLTDNARWSAPSVAVAIVAVLRTPLLDSYGVLETYSRDGADPDRPFVGVRYTKDGTVQVHTRGLQGELQSSSQAARTGQPVIIALGLSQPSWLDVIVADRTTSRVRMNLGGVHPYDARLYVGRAPGQALGAAAMDILEVDYWLDLDGDELLGKVHLLDRIYGVTQ